MVAFRSAPLDFSLFVFIFFYRKIGHSDFLFFPFLLFILFLCLFVYLLYNKVMHRMNHGIGGPKHIQDSFGDANFVATIFLFSFNAEIPYRSLERTAKWATDRVCLPGLIYTFLLRKCDEWGNFRGHNFNALPATTRQCVKRQHQQHWPAIRWRWCSSRDAECWQHAAKKKLSRRLTIILPHNNSCGRNHIAHNKPPATSRLCVCSVVHARQKVRPRTAQLSPTDTDTD